MKAFLRHSAIHWQTSTAGIAAALGIIAGAYKAGMSVGQWVIAAAIALAVAWQGMASADANKTQAPSKAP